MGSAAIECALVCKRNNSSIALKGDELEKGGYAMTVRSHKLTRDDSVVGKMVDSRCYSLLP